MRERLDPRQRYVEVIMDDEIKHQKEIELGSATGKTLLWLKS